MWSLYLTEIRRELPRRQAEHDREGFNACRRLETSIRDAMVIAQRQQAAALLKRQLKGERFAELNLAGTITPDKQQLLAQWEANFAEVTVALAAVCDRITAEEPSYDITQDWPAPEWLAAEGIAVAA